MTVKEKEIRFDYSKLRGRIVEKYGNLTNFCQKTGRDRSAFNMKMLEGGNLRQEVIVAVAEDLDIPETDYKAYFFTPLVEKSKPDDKS